MERNIAMTFLFLAFSGIAWCLSKFALIGYRALRLRSRKRVFDREYADQTAHLRRVK